MSAGPVDVTGYRLDRALELLSAQGVDVARTEQIGFEDCKGEAVYVVRQRRVEGTAVALTTSGQWCVPSDGTEGTGANG